MTVSANIAMGHFFFRFRDVLFPAIFALGLLVFRPRIIGSPSMDHALQIFGAVIALAGQLVRAITIGFEYIERGGKNKRVYASHLVCRGVYGITRNPMYIGNVLIAIGMTMFAGSPAMYLIALPFFLFVYQSITFTEEEYLRAKFGPKYDQYCADVPRFMPTFARISTAFAGMRYDWKSLRKELSTMYALALGILWLPAWRLVFLQGRDPFVSQLPRLTIWTLLATLIYGGLIFLKRRRVFFY